MNLKRNALITLIVGVLISLCGFIGPIIAYSNNYKNNGAVGIIGGADYPTYELMLSVLFDGLPFVLILLGISVVVSAGFCLIFSNTVKSHCNLKTSLTAVGLSCVGALGLVCVVLCFLMSDDFARYTVKYPVIKVLGIVCFAAFIALIAVYLKLRKTNRSAKGILIDALTCLLYAPVFFLAFAYIM